MRILLIEDEPLIAQLVRQLEPGAVIDGPLTSVQGICDYFNARHLHDRLRRIRDSGLQAQQPFFCAMN